MSEQFANNAETILGKAIGIADVELIVSDASAFPQSGSGNWFYLTLQYGKLIEIMKCNDRVGNTLYVDRAQQGTSAKSFPTGTQVEVRLTKATIEAAFGIGGFVTLDTEQTIQAIKHLADSSSVEPSNPVNGWASFTLRGAEADGTGWLRFQRYNNVGSPVDRWGLFEYADNFLIKSDIGNKVFTFKPDGVLSLGDGTESATNLLMGGSTQPRGLNLLDGSDATPSTKNGPLVFVSQRGGGVGWTSGPTSAHGMVTIKLASKGGIAFAPLWTQTEANTYWGGGSTALYARTYMRIGSEDTPFESSFGFASDIQKFYRGAVSGGEINYQNYSNSDDGVTYVEAVGEGNMSCGAAFVPLGSKHLTTGLYFGTQTPSTGRHWTGIEFGVDTIVETGGTLRSVTLTNVGSGYTSEPAVTITGVTGASVVARINGIESVAITNGGAGYPVSTSIPVTASGGGGTGFHAMAVTNGAGVITTVNIKSKGRNYAAAPTLVLDALFTGAGAGAILTPTVGSGKISYLQIITRGTSATLSVPTVGFAGGGGINAAATAALFIPTAIYNRSAVPAMISQVLQPLIWERGAGLYRGAMMVDGVGSTFINASNWCYFTKDGDDLGSLGGLSGAYVRGSHGAFIGSFHHTIQDVTLVNGANNNVVINDNASIIRIIGPTLAFSITGIAGGVHGREIVIINDTTQAMSVNHLDAGSSAGNKIYLTLGADATFTGTNRCAARMVYVNGSAAHAGGNGWITTVTAG